MTATSPAFSVIVPIYNEAQVLPQSLPALLQAIGAAPAEVILVCNGCTDDSAAIARDLVPDQTAVIELTESSKTDALNAGDSAATVFPRFYVDADVLMPPGGFETLCTALDHDQVDMVSPRLRIDTSNSSKLARKVTQTWEALPYAREAAFQCVIGLSQEGRGHWAEFPQVVADDCFIQSHVPAARRRIVPNVKAVTQFADSLPEWIQLRARWLFGQRQLARLGYAAEREAGQRSALIALLRDRKTCTGAIAFIAVRLAAQLWLLCGQFGRRGWFQARSGWVTQSGPDRR